MALLDRVPTRDPRVLLGPHHGEDAAVLDLGGDHYLVLKTDPITFATDEIGWYVVHVNANDIAAAGSVPAFFMMTLLLPEKQADMALAERIFDQIAAACRALDVSLIGGHTEITFGIDRPIVVGTMAGLAPRKRLITTGGAREGDVLIVTKGVPVEATAIIAREKRAALLGRFDAAFLDSCADYLYSPGISVVKDASVALGAGRVHAMHDPTEGGLATGLWEMAEASGKRLVVDLTEVVIPDSARLCAAVDIDPLAAIASGALLIASHPDDADLICASLDQASIHAHIIGHVEAGEPVVHDLMGRVLPRPARDEIARLFE
jgi:hydrogenase maturation factor